MGDIIPIRQNPQAGTIDVGRIVRSKRVISEGLILPAASQVDDNARDDHTSEPIKSIEDIERISDYLITNGRYRDNMLFIVGINFGLRVSDLLTLRFSNLIDEAFTFKTTFPILEKKTRNTRKVARNRYITINEAVMDAVTLYLQHNPRRLDDYMFRSESNNGSASNEPMHRSSVDRMLKGVASELGISTKVSTHTLRKTFGYHQMMMSGNDPRKLLLLQKIFGHSTSAQTLDYIGITNEEIEDAYLRLNLGGKSCYERFSMVKESTIIGA